MQIGLEFHIKRGIVDFEGLDDDEVSLVRKCIELCERGKNEEAVSLLYAKTYFTWDWDWGNGLYKGIVKCPKNIRVPCTKENCLLQAGHWDGNLTVSGGFSFYVELLNDMTAKEIYQWIDDDSLWACGYISAGWLYSTTDGDNVYLVGIDGNTPPCAD